MLHQCGSALLLSAQPAPDSAGQCGGVHGQSGHLGHLLTVCQLKHKYKIIFHRCKNLWKIIQWTTKTGRSQRKSLSTQITVGNWLIETPAWTCTASSLESKRTCPEIFLLEKKCLLFYCKVQSQCMCTGFQFSVLTAKWTGTDFSKLFFMLVGPPLKILFSEKNLKSFSSWITVKLLMLVCLWVCLYGLTEALPVGLDFWSKAAYFPLELLFGLINQLTVLGDNLSFWLCRMHLNTDAHI